MQVSKRLLLTVATLASNHILASDARPSSPTPTRQGQRPVKRDTSQLPRPALGSVPYGADIRSCTVPGKVALTFDDGPWQYTSDLLDTLDANAGAKATFYVVGDNQELEGPRGRIDDPATGYPDILRRMHAAGHQIGSHTWSHANLESLTTEGRRAEILRNEEALASVLGFFPTYLRPPFTSCQAQCIADIGALGYHVANYDVDTKDYEGDYDYSRAVYGGNITSGGSPQDVSYIVLSHDVWDGTVHGFAQFMIDEARNAGFELVTMGNCLGDPPENWYRDASTGGAWTG